MIVIHNRGPIPTVLAVGMLAALWAVTTPSVQAQDSGDREVVRDRAVAIERSIERAREQLDEAARKLAELHSQMWEMETTGSRADEPMLGVLLGDAGTPEGLTLAGVTPEGGAELAGLKAGDRIVELNGVRLDQGGDKRPMHLLSEAMSSVQAGESVPVEYVRDGKVHTAELVTQRRGKYMATMIEEKRPWLESLQSLGNLEDLEALKDLKELELLDEGRLDLEGNVVRVPAGLRLEDVEGDLARYFDVDRGVLVLGISERATVLEAGDILLQVAGEAVTDSDAVLTRMATLEGEVAARVKRRGQEREVSLDMDALNSDQALHVMRGERRIRIQRLGTGEQIRLEITVDD